MTRETSELMNGMEMVKRNARGTQSYSRRTENGGTPNWSPGGEACSRQWQGRESWLPVAGQSPRGAVLAWKDDGLENEWGRPREISLLSPPTATANHSLYLCQEVNNTFGQETVRRYVLDKPHIRNL